MMRALLSLILLGTLARARGSEEATAEGRIRHVVYDQDEVVTIEAVVGVATHLVLEPGEVYVAHAFGDGKAWDFAYRQHHVFLKPVATDADSNLTIVTDRRSYHLALELRTDKAATPTYEVVYRFRESRARKARNEGRDREIDEAFQRPPRAANLRYSMSGDQDIALANCWDDGQFTSFKFASGVDLPAIYLIDADGQESVVDRHSAGAANEIIVVHKVAPRWVLRLGGRVLAVWNDAFSAEGPRNETRTAAPDVSRVLWR